MNDTAAPDSTVPTTAGASDSSASPQETTAPETDKNWKTYSCKVDFSSPQETTAPETDTAQGGTNAASMPERPFSTALPPNLRILFHLPPQRKGYTGRINNSFLYSDKFGRIDKYGRHFWDNPGMHVFEGRLLTMEEFLQPRVQRYLLEDHWTTPVQVRVVTVDGDTVAVVAESTPVEGMPTKDDVRAMLTEMDRLRAAVETAKIRIDELEAENTTFRNAIDQIEKGAARADESTTGSPPGSTEGNSQADDVGEKESPGDGNPLDETETAPDELPQGGNEVSQPERRGPGRPRKTAAKS